MTCYVGKHEHGGRVRALDRVVSFYGHGTYPEAIRQSYANGTSQTFRIEVVQPKPRIFKRSEIARMYRESGGYQFRGWFRKRRMRRAMRA